MKTGGYCSSKEAILKRFEDESQLRISDADGFAAFPDGSAAAICTNCAKRVIQILGRGEIWGFAAADNLCAEAANGQDGHDFAIIDTRLIVDVWLVHFASLSQQAVFDLASQEDEHDILRFYGDRSTWKVVGDTD